MALQNVNIFFLFRDVRDLRLNCSRIALNSVLKSWAGLFEFANPNNESGLKALIDVLYLKEAETRKAILDLFFEVVNVQSPAWIHDYETALNSIDPSDFQDSWRLSDGFVAAEGRCILPSLAANVPNMTEIHLTFLIYCFIENGLIDALIEVIVSSDINLSVRTTVLLGKWLQFMYILLPESLNNLSQSVSKLVQRATENNYHARAALSSLENFQELLKQRPAPCSMYLEQIVQNGNLKEPKIFIRNMKIQDDNLLTKKRSTIERRTLYGSDGSVSSCETSSYGTSSATKFTLKKYKVLNIFELTKECEKVIRSSLVFSSPDSGWDWDLILLLLRNDCLNKMDELNFKFIKALVAYFKPSSNRFSHEELLLHKHSSVSTFVGLELMDWLIKNSDLDSIRLLTDFFTDISNQLLSISTSRSAHDCLFSPQHMSNTMCQQYFLFIGRMCKSEQGLNVLTNTDVFKQ